MENVRNSGRAVEISEYKKGVVFTALSFLIWGCLPIYWKLLSPVNSLAIMFYRMIMAFVFVFIIVGIKYDLKIVFKPLKNIRTAGLFFLAGLLISVNWGLYIWMVNSDMVIQTSLGYYINPLISCLIGAIFFREKITSYKAAAFTLSAIGVTLALFDAVQSPIFALALAISFAFYGAIKKFLHENPIVSLLFETMFMLPLVVPVLLYLETHGNGAFGNASPFQYILLLLCGAVTAIPLILYGAGAIRIPMMTLGMIQYISPTLGFLMGIFIFHEEFSATSAGTFAFIWMGVAVFSYGSWKEAAIEHC